MSSAPVSLLSAHRPVEDPVVRARGLTKVYGRGSGAVTALDAVDVDIARARFTAIMGPSGSGKSTLMHCLAGLDSVSGGQIVLDGLEVSAMSQRRLTRLRRERIGFIFQSFNLVPTLTAAENITLPLDIARTKVDKQRFDQVIEAVGLTDRLSHRPAELSGGQVQRVACARALVGSPAVVFADEPTGNLDSRSTEQVLAILRSSVDALGQSVVMVTHEPEAAAWADTVVFLRDGQVVAELADPDRDRVLDALRNLGEGGGPAAGPGATGQQREPGAE
ncbi:ABC transporter ATP-binding protein [Actinomyces bowdenii]|uniref:ABC transporter ATP-binding protein n=1 Tax=Actinomyces bowdenii TaxID=131109 RepID=A0A3P1V9R5_9ACTO|nr:ABC transporter ATP-binding protein [Actinomyces bowdenii]RRD30889.1 ABC transporter ATP-binding protein [Actinomyces bowdenii]